MKQVGSPERSYRAACLRTTKNSVKAKFGSAPVRWDRNSRVIAMLRVATPCYTTEQRTLPGRGFRTPKRPHRAVLEVLEPSSVGRLLRRTSENFNFPRTPVNRG